MSPSKGRCSRLQLLAGHCCSGRTAAVRMRARSISTLPRSPVFEAITGHQPQHAAVIDSKSGRRFTYRQLLLDVQRSRTRLREIAPTAAGLEGQRIAFLVENGYDYVGAPVIRELQPFGDEAVLKTF